MDRSADALRQLLGLHQLNVAVEHEYIGNPVGEGMIQEFHITGAELKVSKVEFGDTLATASRAIQIHVSENVLGKPYSRMMIDLFLSEQVRPVYAQKGYLRARIGPPEIRLSADPTKPLSSSVPVFVPISSGAIFRWRGVEWSGNTALTTDQLNAALGMKTGAVADGTAIQAGFDRTQEEYGRRGYLDAVVHPQPEFDDQAGTVSYRVPITEGVQYRYNDFVITGASLAAEKKIRAAWTVAQGEVFDKIKFEDLLAKLQARKEEIFGDLPVHYDEVGHWLRTDAQKRTVDVLLDFK